MFFLNKIHEPPGGACPTCGQSNWKSLTWQLPFRYSMSTLIMILADSISLAVLLLLWAEHNWGADVVRPFLSSPIGWLCAAAGGLAASFVAYSLVRLSIITKYWSKRSEDRIRAYRCCHCRKDYLFVYSERSIK